MCVYVETYRHATFSNIVALKESALPRKYTVLQKCLAVGKFGEYICQIVRDLLNLNQPNFSLIALYNWYPYS